MNKLYLVSVIERGEDGDDFYTDFHVFTMREDAEDFYKKEHEHFLANFGDDNDWDDTTEEDNHVTYTWADGENHWEIHLTELMPK